MTTKENHLHQNSDEMIIQIIVVIYIFSVFNYKQLFKKHCFFTSATSNKSVTKTFGCKNI